MRKLLYLFLFLGAALVLPHLVAAQAPAGEWPGWRGALRDGKSPDTGLLKQWPQGGPPLLWQVNGIGQGFSSVAVSGGTIYTTGIVGGQLVISTFDTDGKPGWQAPFGPEHGNVPGSRATPTIDGGSLYLISGTGRIGCFDAKTGAPRWTKEMSDFGGRPHNWGYAESVLIRGDYAFITPGGQQCIVALNKRTGEKVWASSGFSAPAHYGSLLPITFEGTPMLVAGTGLGLMAVGIRDGKPIWWNSFSERNTANCPTPAYSDGYVFWANGYGKGGICLKLTSANGQIRAEEAWRTTSMNCHHGGYIIHEGFIYGNNGNGFACLDLKTGQVRWNDRGVGKGSLCYADGMLYLFSEKGGLAGLAPASPDGFRMTGQFNAAGKDPSWAHPVVIGGRLYLRNDDNLYCYNVKQ